MDNVDVVEGLRKMALWHIEALEAENAALRERVSALELAQKPFGPIHRPTPCVFCRDPIGHGGMQCPVYPAAFYPTERGRNMTDMEYAALVMSSVLTRHASGWYYYSPTLDDAASLSFQPFSPERDDGDSRRLEIACLNWIGRVMECPKSVTKAYAELTGLVCYGGDITPEQYRAAVFALAVEIGKTIEGKDNAG